MGIGRGTRSELLELVDNAPAQAAPQPQPQVRSAPESFETFYRRQLPQLLVLARALVGPLMAEDVAQEAMIVVNRRWPEIQLLESPEGWARSVCLHKGVSLARRRTVEQRVLRQLGSFRTSAAPRVEEDEKFWSLVRRLPRRQAQVVALHYALDLGVAEIATTLDCAEGTVKIHLSRARAALAESLGLDAEEKP
jgi:RNA polymerase sigma-70 factor (ECF subfamily)